MTSRTIHVSAKEVKIKEITGRQTMQYKLQILECGPMPNVMAALTNIGASSVQRRKVCLTPNTRVQFSSV